MTETTQFPLKKENSSARVHRFPITPGSAIVLPVKRVPVESKQLMSIGYDAGEETLEVEFQSTRVYRYFGVNPQLHDWLMRAPGKMGMLNRLVIGKFKEEEVVSPTEPQDLVALLSQSLEANHSEENNSEHSDSEHSDSEDGDSGDKTRR